MSDTLPADLAAALDATRGRRGHLGDPVHYFAETTSTNDRAAAYASHGAPEGTMVVAASQTAGRGRLGRSWYSPPGAGLYASLVLRSRRAAPFLTLLAGVAVADGIRHATGLGLEIKWPNDVVTPRGPGAPPRKIAGILAEASSSADGLDYVVLGFGINIQPVAYPPDLANRASSLETELGRAVDMGAVLAQVLIEFAAGLPSIEAGDPAPLLARWRALAPSVRGTAVECDSAAGRIRGVAAGVADDGALLVRVDGRTERVVAGEVIWT
jgi:BirA family transcriptional regulator, biotin operon repressor / biotin---[acetyl-CoA-carboxylase] ligase